MSGQTSDSTELIDAVLAEVRGHVAADQRGVVEAFVGHYFAGTAYEDLAENEVANLYGAALAHWNFCLLYTSPSPRDRQKSRMPSSA